MALAEELLDAVGLAYEAALAPELWPSALERFADLVGGHSVGLVFEDVTAAREQAVAARLDPAALHLYLGYYADRNPLKGTSPPGARVLTDEHKLPKRELMRTEYYNDFMRRQDADHALIVRLAIEKTTNTVMSIGRPARRGQYESGQIRIAEMLQPHLSRALALGMRLSGLQRLNESFSEFLDRSPYGVFVVHADARVRFANRVGEILVAGGRGLSIREGVLRAATSDSTRRLQQLVAAAGASDAERRSGGALSIARPSRRKNLSVIVAPLRSGRLPLFQFAPSVLVCASDPDSDVAVPEQRLQDLFGLTQAESRIAVELLAGGEPKAIAERLALSIHTVRVHLAHIMAKTETSRQAELVHLLERVSGVWVGAGNGDGRASQGAPLQ